MFQNVEMMLGLSSTDFSIAQVSAPPIQPEVALVFSSPQFFIALIAGVIMAFAFQFLLTNLSIAAGISSGDNPLDDDEDEHESISLGKKIRKVESKVGLWTLLTVNVAIFVACFLAVKLSLINSIFLGAIVGVVIWSAYFLMLMWVSSSAIGSLVGSVASTASSGLQGVMATAATALGGSAVNAQVVNTVEASVAAVRRELSSAIDPSSVKETVQEYLGNLPKPNLDLKQIRNEFENLLTNSELRSLTDSDLLSNVNRQTFVDLVSSRTDFSKQDINKVADQLEAAWQKVIGKQQQADPQAQLLNFLKEAAPEQLKSNELTNKVAQLVGVGQEKGQNGNGGGVIGQAMQLGVNAFLSTVLSRTDLSDLDVEKISSQLQQLKEQTTEQAKTLATKVADKVPAFAHNTIKADVENYLLNSQPWHLNRETIKKEFRDVIYDPEASPGKVRQQLEQLNQDYFLKVLGSRENFSEEQGAEIATQLEEIRKEIFETVQSAESQERSQDLRSRIENYLSSTGKEELNPEGIERDFKALLEDPESGVDALRDSEALLRSADRLSQFDRDTFVAILGQRSDFSQEEADQLIGQLEGTRDRVLSEAQELQEQAKSKAQEIWQNVESYLRNTNKEELNPEGIKRELQTLLDDPQAGFSALRTRLSHFDRDTVVQLLNQRQDLSEEQINQVLDQIESVRDNILHAPQELAGKAKEQYDKVTNQIAEYLRNTNREELNPEGIKRDLTKLLDDPKEGALALRERLSHVDRETLVKLLSQREDLSEEQVNQIIDQVQRKHSGNCQSTATFS